jgi:hypothetical protein
MARRARTATGLVAVLAALVIVAAAVTAFPPAAGAAAPLRPSRITSSSAADSSSPAAAIVVVIAGTVRPVPHPTRPHPSSSAALHRSPRHAFRAAPLAGHPTALLVLLVVAGQRSRAPPCDAEATDRFAVAGGDPVNGRDPSGDWACSPEPWTWLGCAGDLVDAAGEIVDAGAAASLGVAVDLGIALGAAVAVAWATLTPTKAGGYADIPIWFGQPRISPNFGDGVPITAPPDNYPIRVFPWEVNGQPVAVAINNRTLANYSLYDVMYPPVIWQAPSEARIEQLGESTLILGSTLPSPVVLVTPNKDCPDPVDIQGSVDGIITSTAYAQLAV